jgi:hypothetical protein
VQGAHFAAFADEYQAILARARQIVADFPPLMRALARSRLPQWSEGHFARIVALLAYWVADLLDQLPSPRSSARSGELETLDLADLLGWWSYQIQDELLDGELGGQDLLPLATAFHTTAVALLARLLPGDEVFWQAFQRQSLTTAEAHIREHRRRFWSLEELTGDDLDGPTSDLDNPDRLADRSSLLQWAAIALLAARGYGPENSLYTALSETLRQYAIARQIADDLGDWVEDLQNGRLNYVSARIMHRMVESGVAQTPAELDAAWMTGYFLHDDELFTDIQQVALGACQRAGEALAPYGPRYLSALVDELRRQLEGSYRAAMDHRRTLWATL